MQSREEKGVGSKFLLWMCDPNNNNNCSYALSGMEKWVFQWKQKFLLHLCQPFPDQRQCQSLFGFKYKATQFNTAYMKWKKGKIKNVKYDKIRRRWRKFDLINKKYFSFDYKQNRTFVFNIALPLSKKCLRTEKAYIIKLIKLCNQWPDEDLLVVMYWYSKN